MRTESQIFRGAASGAAGGDSVESFPNAGTVVRAGMGLFYDRVPLNVYSFDHYPNQMVTNITRRRYH